MASDAVLMVKFEGHRRLFGLTAGGNWNNGTKSTPIASKSDDGLVAVGGLKEIGETLPPTVAEYRGLCLSAWRWFGRAAVYQASIVCCSARHYGHRSSGTNSSNPKLWLSERTIR